MEENVRINIHDQVKDLGKGMGENGHNLLYHNVLYETGKGRSNSHAKWIPLLDKAMKHASKQKGQDGNKGHIDMAYEVNDKISDKTFLIIIETKDNADNIKYPNNSQDSISLGKEKNDIKDYAINGAVWYAKSIQKQTSMFNNIFAVGVAGIGESQKQYCCYVSPNKIEMLSMSKFNISYLMPNTISDTYLIDTLHQEVPQIKNEKELKKLANDLSEDMRNYTSLSPNQRAPLVAGILLALHEGLELSNIGYQNDVAKTKNDGHTILDYIQALLDKKRNNSRGSFPQSEVSSLMDNFNFINDSSLYKPKSELNYHSPLFLFVAKLRKIVDPIKKNKDIDTIGDFYQHFVKYDNSDGHLLGIVLTPIRVTRLMARMADIHYPDNVLDPTAGSGTFIISAMSELLNSIKDQYNRKDLKQDILNNHLYGIERNPKVYPICLSNMILRGDGNSNIKKGDCFDYGNNGKPINVTSKIDDNGEKVNGEINKILMNPPYSQGKSNGRGEPEIKFVVHALKTLHKGGVLCAIVPTSIFNFGKQAGGKGVNRDRLKDDKLWIVNHCQLNDVVTMNDDLFYPKGKPALIVKITKTSNSNDNEDKNKRVTCFRKSTTLINFTNDGYHLVNKKGMQPIISKKDAHIRYKLIAKLVKNGYISDSERKIIKPKDIIHRRLKYSDEWIFNAFYTNKKIPSNSKFERSVADYLSFKTSEILKGRGYLFKDKLNVNHIENFVKYVNRQKIHITNHMLRNRHWKLFKIEDIFRNLKKDNIPKRIRFPGSTPLIGALNNNNGVSDYIKDNSAFTKHCNCISFNTSGQGGLGLAFYQPYNAYYSNNTIPLRTINQHISTDTKLFLCTSIKDQRKRFSYGYIPNEGRLMKLKINLPVTYSSYKEYKQTNNYKCLQPDYQFMKQYIESMVVTK